MKDTNQNQQEKKKQKPTTTQSLLTTSKPPSRNNPVICYSDASTQLTSEHRVKLRISATVSLTENHRELLESLFYPLRSHKRAAGRGAAHPPCAEAQPAGRHVSERRTAGPTVRGAPLGPRPARSPSAPSEKRALLAAEPRGKRRMLDAAAAQYPEGVGRRKPRRAPGSPHPSARPARSRAVGAPSSRGSGATLSRPAEGRGAALTEQRGRVGARPRRRRVRAGVGLRRDGPGPGGELRRMGGRQREVGGRRAARRRLGTARRRQGAARQVVEQRGREVQRAEGDEEAAGPLQRGAGQRRLLHAAALTGTAARPAPPPGTGWSRGGCGGGSARWGRPRAPRPARSLCLRASPRPAGGGVGRREPIRAVVPLLPAPRVFSRVTAVGLGGEGSGCSEDVQVGCRERRSVGAGWPRMWCGHHAALKPLGDAALRDINSGRDEVSWSWTG